MLPGKHALADLIGRIYDAAADPTLWESFLEQLAKICRADASGLVMHNDRPETHAIAVAWRVDPEMLRLYREYYGPLDIWTNRGRPNPAGWAGTSQELCALNELKKAEVYNDLMVRSQIEHGMFGIFEREGTRWAGLSLYRSASSGEFRVSDLDIIRFLIPHMQRAFKLHFQFSELRERAERTETALDMLSTSVIFLGDKGEIVLMNRSADELLRRKGGLRLERGKFITSLCSESAALQSMISAGVQTGNGTGLSAGGTMLITREKGRPLSVTVAPMRNTATAFEKRPAAVLFISDPDQKSELPADLLQRCYGFTAAEARLAMLLVEGRALNEAAEFSGITRNTAKTQLKNIFAKTQVQRQGELIRLLLRSFPLTHA
jgi:DNA-binding CsgD family transcriptional regulator